MVGDKEETADMFELFAGGVTDGFCWMTGGKGEDVIIGTDVIFAFVAAATLLVSALLAAALLACSLDWGGKKVFFSSAFSASSFFSPITHSHTL